MNPNHRLAVLRQRRERTPALAKSNYVFAVTKCVKKKTGQEDEKAETQEKAVDEVHR